MSCTGSRGTVAETIRTILFKVLILHNCLFVFNGIQYFRLYFILHSFLTKYIFIASPNLRNLLIRGVLPQKSTPKVIVRQSTEWKPVAYSRGGVGSDPLTMALEWIIFQILNFESNLIHRSLWLNILLTK